VRIAVGVALVIALVVAATATGVVAGTESNADTRGVVLFVGDSNVTISAMEIVWSTTLLDNHYDDAYVPVLASRVGATIRTHDCVDAIGCASYNYWQIKLGNVLGKVKPDAIVNNLGINDTVYLGTQGSPGYAAYGKKIDWFMRLIPKSTPVFWTNLPCLVEPGIRGKGCKAVNAALADAHERWPNFVLVNWAKKANTHLEYMARTAAGKPDVHMSATGSAAWIALVTAAMDRRMPPN
jgi:hypothetical protein